MFLSKAIALFTVHRKLEQKDYVEYRIETVSDQTMDNAEDIYSDLVEDLLNLGYYLEDLYIEHDCISGILKEI